MAATAGAHSGSVAVIGAGIAGMTCAAALAEAGLAVEIFEKSSTIGGRPLPSPGRQYDGGYRGAIRDRSRPGLPGAYRPNGGGRRRGPLAAGNPRYPPRRRRRDRTSRPLVRRPSRHGRACPSPDNAAADPFRLAGHRPRPGARRLGPYAGDRRRGGSVLRRRDHGSRAADPGVDRRPGSGLRRARRCRHVAVLDPCLRVRTANRHSRRRGPSEPQRHYVGRQELRQAGTQRRGRGLGDPRRSGLEPGSPGGESRFRRAGRCRMPSPRRSESNCHRPSPRNPTAGASPASRRRSARAIFWAATER